MKERRKWPWVLLVVGILYALFTITVVQMDMDRVTQSSNRNTSYSSNSSKYKKSEDADICIEPNCYNKKMEGGSFCSSHTCHYSGCRNRRSKENIYCSLHQFAITEKKNNSGSNKKQTDPYDIDSYDDPDDFYDDYFYEFEDYDEAEQYWDEN